MDNPRDREEEVQEEIRRLKPKQAKEIFTDEEVAFIAFPLEGSGT